MLVNVQQLGEETEILPKYYVFDMNICCKTIIEIIIEQSCHLHLEYEKPVVRQVKKVNKQCQLYNRQTSIMNIIIL